MTKEIVVDYFAVGRDDASRLKRPKPNHWVFLTGISMVTLGIVTLVSWPVTYKYIKNIAVVMSPESFKFTKWAGNTVPIITNVYFFNWTNPEEILDENSKPSFEEVGPYTFIESRYKENVSWNENGTITFRQRRLWHFDPERSARNLSDRITTINAVALSAAYKTRELNFFLNRGLSTAMISLNIKMYVVKEVRELMFDGYRDPLLDIGHTLPLPKDTVPKMDKFGWFYSRNDSTDFDGTLNMATDPFPSIGQIRSLNYDSRVPYNGGPCGDVKGSFPDIYPPNLSKDDLQVFATELCRSVPVEFEKESDWNGILSYKYILGKRFLDNGTQYPEYKCYHEGENIPSGLYNVSLCRYGTPSFISLPHFYGADPIYVESVRGVEPSKERHEFNIKIEPETGLPLEVKGRVQVNMLLQKIPSVSLYRKAPRVFMPVFWFEQLAAVPEDYLWQIKLMLRVPLLSMCLASSLIIVGLVLFLFVVGRRRCGRGGGEKSQKALLGR